MIARGRGGKGVWEKQRKRKEGKGGEEGERGMENTQPCILFKTLNLVSHLHHYRTLCSADYNTHTRSDNSSLPARRYREN